MIKTVISLFIIAVCNFTFASSNIDSLIDSGVSSTYNFEFDKAEETWQKLIELFPEDPRGYYYLSQTHLWFYLGSRDEGQLRIFEEYTNITFEKLEEISDSVENDPEFIELEANLYLQKAMVAGVEQSTLDAFFATKSAYSRFEDVLEVDSTYARAYLGLGLLEYALSYVPGFFRWALAIAGLGSDKEKGFELVQKALKHADSQNESSEIEYHYSKMLLEYLGDSEASINLLNELISRYPKNILFRYQLVLAFIEARNLKSALSHLQYILANQDRRFIQTVAFSYFLLGEIDFRFGKYKQSIDNYERFFELSRGFEYSGMAYYNIALSNLFINRPEEAKKNLLLARNGNSEISDDLYAARRSELIFDAPDKVGFLTVAKARNLLQSAKYDTLQVFLNRQIDSLKGDNKIEASIILAEAYLQSDSSDSATEILDNIVIDELETELWLEPYFYYLKAWLFLEQGDMYNFHQFIEKAIESNNHDFIEKNTTKINYLRSKKIDLR